MNNKQKAVSSWTDILSSAKNPLSAHSPTPSAIVKWAADSVVKSSDGQPMTVYHGTDAEVTGDLQDGTWFSVDPEIASEYAELRHEMAGEGGKVLPAYLNIKRPFDLGHDSREITPGDIVALLSDQSGTGQEDSQIMEAVEEFYDSWGGKDSSFPIESFLTGEDGEGFPNDLLDLIELFGFDGVHLIEGGGSTYAPLRSHQIRLALCQAPESSFSRALSPSRNDIQVELAP